MERTRNISKVFLDTSALLSGLNSPLGGAGIILALFKLRKIYLVISPEVLIEAERNIQAKFPLLKAPFQAFLANKPIITKKITSRELLSAYDFIPSEDAPIAAGAIKANVDFIITLDKRFQRLAKTNDFSILILTPGEFLQSYKN